MWFKGYGGPSITGILSVNCDSCDGYNVSDCHACRCWWTNGRGGVPIWPQRGPGIPTCGRLAGLCFLVSCNGQTHSGRSQAGACHCTSAVCLWEGRPTQHNNTKLLHWNIYVVGIQSEKRVLFECLQVTWFRENVTASQFHLGVEENSRKYVNKCSLN